MLLKELKLTFEATKKNEYKEDVEINNKKIYKNPNEKENTVNRYQFYLNKKREKNAKFLPKRYDIKEIDSNLKKIRPKTCISNKNKLKQQEIKSNNLDINLANIHNKNKIENILKKEFDDIGNYKKKNIPKNISLKPYNKIQKGLNMFNEVFIKPKIELMDKLKLKGEKFTNLLQYGINEQYDNLLNLNLKKKNKKEKKEKIFIKDWNNKTKNLIKEKFSNLSSIKQRPLSAFINSDVISKINSKNIENFQNMLDFNKKRIESANPNTNKPRITSANPTVSKPRITSANPIKRKKIKSPSNLNKQRITSANLNNKKDNIISRFENEMPEIIEEIDDEVIELNENSYEKKPNSNDNDNNSINIRKMNFGFFDQIILIQIPEIPKRTKEDSIDISNYAKSIPIFYENLDKLTYKEIKLKKECFKNKGNPVLEAHSNFIYGYFYENKKRYKTAFKYYEIFYKNALLLNDKIGISFSLNRLANCKFNLNEYETTWEFLLKNKKIIDQENIFLIYYNLGIVYRKLNDIKNSDYYFKLGKKWSKKKNDIESLCLIYGQIGVNFHSKNDEKYSIKYYKKCKEISKKNQNIKIQLDCLINSINVQSNSFKFDNNNFIIEENIKEAINIASLLNDKESLTNYNLDLGIVEGEKKFQNFIKNVKI